VGLRSTSFCYASQSASFSLDAFKPSIVFQSTAEGVDMHHLITYEFLDGLKQTVRKCKFSDGLGKTI
jgi:hypothetical protein